MTGSVQARRVLAWLDYASPPAIAKAQRACRGRKDTERMRQRLRQIGWPEDSVRLMTEAAQRRDPEFILKYDFLRFLGAVE